MAALQKAATVQPWITRNCCHLTMKTLVTTHDTSNRYILLVLVISLTKLRLCKWYNNLLHKTWYTMLKNNMIVKVNITHVNNHCWVGGRGRTLRWRVTFWKAVSIVYRCHMTCHCRYFFALFKQRKQTCMGNHGDEACNIISAQLSIAVTNNKHRRHVKVNLKKGKTCVHTCTFSKGRSCLLVWGTARCQCWLYHFIPILWPN